MAKLPPEFDCLVDEISASANPCWDGEPAVFIDGSPMMHDTRFSLRVQSHPRLIAAAIFYDFDTLDSSGYVATVATRIEYLAKLARIRKFDLFFPASQYTASLLFATTGVSRGRIRVTGASVGRDLYESRNRLTAVHSPYARNPPYFVTSAGDNSGKSTKTVVRALQRLNQLGGCRALLKVVGFCDDANKLDLLGLAGHRQGHGFLEFHSYTSAEEFVSLYAGAVAAIVPWCLEGFPHAVVEASVCECPAIVSACAAHSEVVDKPEALFPRDDSFALSEKLKALLCDPALRTSLVGSQEHLRRKFHEDAVGDRFWGAIKGAIEKRRDTVTPQKLRLAFMSPYTPDASDAAHYAAGCIKAGKDEELFDSDVYTNVARAITYEGAFSDVAAISLAPFVDRRYNAIVSVLGNSHWHKRAFEVFERYGGPCILHDVRLTHIYFARLGAAEFLRFAGGLLNRPVLIEEAHAWLQDQNPPSLFVEGVIDRAAPLMVHSSTQRALLKKRYAVEAHVLTSCPTVIFEERELTAGARQIAREKLGIHPNTFLISSFGPIEKANEMHTCILALELLRSWNIPAELYFAGDVGSHKDEIERISALYEVARHIHFGSDLAADAAYRDFLIASDAAAQLQPYGFGQPPINLSNCVSAGLRAVANKDAAESCDVPAYVSMVPDVHSPLQVAEELALIWEARTAPETRTDARSQYLQTHNFAYYAKRLVEVLRTA
jgi:glycosyltransferase involved in cell wall biosynthesis